MSRTPALVFGALSNLRPVSNNSTRFRRTRTTFATRSTSAVASGHTSPRRTPHQAARRTAARYRGVMASTSLTISAGDAIGRSFAMSLPAPRIWHGFHRDRAIADRAVHDRPQETAGLRDRCASTLARQRFRVATPHRRRRNRNQRPIEQVAHVQTHVPRAGFGRPIRQPAPHCDSRWRCWATRRRSPAMHRRSGSGHAHAERGFAVIVEMVRRVGLRRVAQRGARIPQSMSMRKVFSLRYSDERAIPRAAAACTRLPPASRNASRIASRSIDSSALSVLPEIWQQ
jgi:hypothetical protein